MEMTLSGQEFVTYDLSSHGDSIVSKNDEIRLQFRTRQSTGLLFYTGTIEEVTTACGITSFFLQTLSTFKMYF